MHHGTRGEPGELANWRTGEPGDVTTAANLASMAT
jgi:hypothetical protein